MYTLVSVVAAPREPTALGSVGVHSPATTTNISLPSVLALCPVLSYISPLAPRLSPFPFRPSTWLLPLLHRQNSAQRRKPHHTNTHMPPSSTRISVETRFSRTCPGVSPSLVIYHTAALNPISRFILNLPEEELASVERVCFQVEQASVPPSIHPDSSSKPLSSVTGTTKTSSASKIPPSSHHIHSRPFPKPSSAHALSSHTGQRIMSAPLNPS